jgi:hypothetical protein
MLTEGSKHEAKTKAKFFSNATNIKAVIPLDFGPNKVLYRTFNDPSSLLLLNMNSPLLPFINLSSILEKKQRNYDTTNPQPRAGVDMCLLVCPIISNLNQVRDFDKIRHKEHAVETYPKPYLLVSYNY